VSVAGARSFWLRVRVVMMVVVIMVAGRMNMFVVMPLVVIDIFVIAFVSSAKI